MTIGTGLGASVGLAAESVYGTYTAPARWVEFNSETLNYAKQTIQSGGLRGGGMVPRASRRRISLVGGAGDVNFQVPTTGFGLWLAHTLGGGGTPTVSGAGNLQMHYLDSTANLYGKSLTIQKGIPQTDGTVKPFSFLGSKIVQMVLSCDTGGFLTAAATIDSRDVDKTTSLVTPTYDTTSSAWAFLDGAIYAGGSPTFSTTALATGGTAIASIKSLSLTIPNASATERNYFGSGGRKAEPLLNAERAVNGTLTADFTDTTFSDAFITDASLSIVLTFTHPTLIGGTTYPVFQIAMPAVKLNGDLPQVGGPDIVTISAGFNVLDNGTQKPLYIGYLSSDAAI